MTRDPRLPMRPDPLDDAMIGQLVRDAADGWTMPAVRLDAPSWRDRVRTPGARRLAALGGWARRLGRAATAAVALTVAGAVIAIMITRPAVGPGKSPGASSDGTPGPTGEAQSTPLPKLLVTGELPSPSSVVVGTEDGDFALANLADGVLGPPITGADFGSELRVNADGSMTCLCISASDVVRGMATRVIVALDRFDASGARLPTTPLGAYAGEPDRRDAQTPIPMDPPHVLVEVSFSDDGQYGYVGWSGRTEQAWRSGLAVVAIQSGDVVATLDLPDGSTGEGEARRVEMAPRVVGRTGSDRLLVARDWWGWTPAGASSPAMSVGTNVWEVPFDGVKLSAGVLVEAASECGNAVLRGGALPIGGMWLACARQGGSQTIVQRFGEDRTFVSEVRGLGSLEVDFGSPLALSADGATLFVWDATTLTMTRIDLASGEKESNRATAAAVSDPLTALGSWLAPVAAAKTFIRGSIVLSPDGTTVYAIGINGSPDEHDVAGSAGVFVFDAATLDVRATWEPTADFVSIALSPDGAWLYAAGMPGVDAQGTERRSQGASITIFDTSDGSRRQIAGQLGPDLITFASPLAGRPAG